MKHIFWAVLFILAAGTAFAQVSGVTVSLAATPANVTQIGNNVLLTATVRTPGVAVQPIGGGTVYDRDRMRFTFKAQRTWPCPAAATIIAENVKATSGTSSPTVATHTAPAHFVQPPAGEYALSVVVTYISTPRLKTLQEPLLRPQTLGSATLSKYTVKPQPGWSGNVKTTFSPPSPATMPASGALSVGLTVSMYFSQEYRWYRYTNRNCMGCPPGTATQNKVSSANFSMQIPSPGSYMFPIDIDKVIQYPGQSDCTWEQSIQMPHTTPAWYYVNSAPSQ